jgi:Protein kinase domain
VTAPADPRLGTRLAGYRIQALLGRGGMGVVYLAEQERPHRQVALKLLSSPVATSEAFRERFLRESELAAAIDHPNVLPVYDAGETDGVLWIAMRHVDGIDLAGLLASDGPLAPEPALDIVGRSRGRWTPPMPAGWSIATSSRATSCWPWTAARSPTPIWPTSG